MYRTLLMTCTLCVGLLLLGRGNCAEKNVESGHVSLNRIIERIQANEIESIQILWQDPSAESRAMNTPDVLEKRYSRKLDMRAVPSSKQIQTLIVAMRATSLAKMDPGAEGDVHWAIKFYEKDSIVPAEAIYLGGGGENGSVRGAPYSFNRPLINWLNSAFFAASAARGRKQRPEAGVLESDHYRY